MSTSKVSGTAREIFGERDPNGTDPHATGAKLDFGKAPVVTGLIQYFPRALMAVANVSAAGAIKYTRGGWKTVPDGIDRYADANGRHMLYSAMGIHDDNIDPQLLEETGMTVKHDEQEAWNALAKLELRLLRDENDGLESKETGPTPA